ncbi:MAG: hypothetical protein OXK80_00010 [Bdellovibrionales bacterium]|nr:hypothetical protein [Bdellovibrionales bacterium]
MKVFYLMFIVFAVAYGGISCTQPTTSELGSERDDDDRDDDDDNRRTRTCSDRDSCQDTCDDLFSYTTERYGCYDLDPSEVNVISKVSDELERNLVRSNELEDIDADDFRAYLEIGMESFIDLVRGVPVGDSAKDNNRAQWNTNANVVTNSTTVMEWIAEEENIAEVILEQDRDFELGLELFQALAVDVTFDPPITNAVLVGTGVCVDFLVGNRFDIGDSLSSSDCASPKELLDLSHFNGMSGVSKFLSGFLLAQISGDSFMTFSADERNDTAFEWGHNTLLEFCKEATDEDEGDVEVKTCLQTAYCVHRSIETGGITSDGIFKDLDDHDGVVGRTDVDHCDDLDDEDRMEDLFD